MLDLGPLIYCRNTLKMRDKSRNISKHIVLPSLRTYNVNLFGIVREHMFGILKSCPSKRAHKHHLQKDPVWKLLIVGSICYVLLVSLGTFFFDFWCHGGGHFMVCLGCPEGPLSGGNVHRGR